MLNFYSGSSNAVNTATAMRESLDLAFGEGGGGDADLLVLHATMGHNFPQLLAAARDACPKARIIGCSGSGVIAHEGVSENMRALAAMAVTGDEIAVATAEGLTGGNSFEVAAEAAEKLKAERDGIQFIYILTAGLDLSGNRVIAGVESVFGTDTALFGATSADNGKAKRSFQIADDKVVEDGILLVGFADPTLELICGVHHGSLPLEGTTMEVTKANANEIIELDGQPAWPTLMGKLGLGAEAEPGETLPIAGVGEKLSDDDQAAYDNSHILRVPIGVADDHQSFYLPVAPDEGTQLTLVQRDEDHIFDGLDRLMGRIGEQLGERRPAAVFHADCMARGRLTFDRVLKDEIIAKMHHPICRGEKVPWLGVYGFSEYCRIADVNWFHSYTTALYMLVRKEAA